MCGDGAGMGTNVWGAGGCGVANPIPYKTLFSPAGIIF